MKINWNPNPLNTTIELDETEKKVLRCQIKIDFYEEYLIRASSHLLTSEEINYLMDGGILYRNTFDNQIDSTLNSCLQALLEPHCGDCVCVSCTCMKCCAEDWLGINTIPDLSTRLAASIDGAFYQRSLDEALEYLRTYDPGDKPSSYSALQWREACHYCKQEASKAYQWLLKYKNDHQEAFA